MWIVLSLLTAISLATSDALTKKALVSRDEYFVAWVRLIFALPLLLISMLFVEVPSLDKTFWLATICALPLEIAAIILYTKALKVSPISLSMPLLALTPLFLIFTSSIMLGEGVSVYGGIGILLMAIGSYSLNIHMISKNVLEPIKAILREKGCVMMIIVAFIFSITASLGKVAIEHSSPVFFGGFYFVLVTILFTPIALKMNRGRINIEKKDVIPLALIGITFSLMIVFHNLAVSMSNVAYMISIKRTSLLFSIAYGHYLFKEERITEKTFGSIIMLAGFVLIVLGK
jgi:drug/metabolite transporter (DMT)-like permease